MRADFLLDNFEVRKVIFVSPYAQFFQRNDFTLHLDFPISSQTNLTTPDVAIFLTIHFQTKVIQIVRVPALLPAAFIVQLIITLDR